MATPLEAVEEPLDQIVITWLLSASGDNVDIIAAAKALIERCESDGATDQLCRLGADAAT